jgi:hypothetical protein
MGSAFERPVSVAKQSVPFGTLTLGQVRARADELRAAVGWGPTAKVRPVAEAWETLASGMETAGAATVADYGQPAEDMAQALWVIPPGGSLL